MLIVWDFDRTITLLHTCQPIAIKKDQIQTMELRHLVADSNLLIATWTYLRAMGHTLAIASYGRREIIAALFERLTLKVDHIVTPNMMKEVYGVDWYDGYAPPTGVDKVIMLNHLAKITGYKRNDIVLLDDTKINIDNALKAGYLGLHMIEPYSINLYRRFDLDWKILEHSWTMLCIKLGVLQTYL
jgi:HAD superfamily phosphatase (TIGR01681 family)